MKNGEERTVVEATGGALDLGVSVPSNSGALGNVPSGIANSCPPSNDSSPMVDSSPAATSSTRDSMKSQRSATVEEVSPAGERGMEIEEDQNNHQERRDGHASGQVGASEGRRERNGVVGVGVNGWEEPN